MPVISLTVTLETHRIVIDMFLSIFALHKHDTVPHFTASSLAAA